MRAQSAQQTGPRLRRIRYGCAHAPDRLRPRSVIALARDHMHMELRHDIAQRGDIELVRDDQRAQDLSTPFDFIQKLMLIRMRKVDPIAHIGAAGYQDHPGKARVVHQQDARQLKVSDRMGVGCKLCVEIEILRINGHLQFASR